MSLRFRFGLGHFFHPVRDSNRQSADLAQRLKKALLEAPKPIQRRYVHGLVSEIRVDVEKVVIAGSRAAIAAAVTSGQ